MSNPRIALGVTMLFACGCAASLTLVSFSVTRDVDEDPFPGATAVRVSVRQDGVLLPRAAAETPLTGAPFATPTVPFGAGYTLRVDVLDGDLLLARGTSTTFAASRSGDEVLPDVFVAPLGRFASLAPRSHPVPTAAALADEAIVLGNADGSVSALDLHDASTRELLAAGPARAFVALPGGLLMVAGSDASFFDDEVHSVSALELVRHGADALLVPAVLGGPGGLDDPCAFMLGGRSDPRALTRLCVVGGVLNVTPLSDLGLGGWGGVGAHVGLTGGGTRVAWVAREDAGGISTGLTLVDPAAPEDVHNAALNLPTSGSAVVANATGELLVIGGRSQAGAVLADVVRVVLQESGPSPAVRAAPAPEPLFSPREGGAVSQVAAGVYLLYGGAAMSGGPVARAELVDVRGFPGVVAPTGELPATASVVVPLDDHAQLAVGGSGVWRYAAPRGFP